MPEERGASLLRQAALTSHFARVCGSKNVLGENIVRILGSLRSLCNLPAFWRFQEWGRGHDHGCGEFLSTSSFFLSFLHPYQHTARLGTMQESGSAPIQKLCSGRFPGQHVRIICSGYGGNSMFAELWRDMSPLSQHLLRMLGDKRTGQQSTVTQNNSNHWEKHQLFFMVPGNGTLSRYERRHRPTVVGSLLGSGGYWGLWLPRQARERVIIWEAVFSHYP